MLIGQTLNKSSNSCLFKHPSLSLSYFLKIKFKNSKPFKLNSTQHVGGILRLKK